MWGRFVCRVEGDHEDQAGGRLECGCGGGGWSALGGLGVTAGGGPARTEVGGGGCPCRGGAAVRGISLAGEGAGRVRLTVPRIRRRRVAGRVVEVATVGGKRARAGRAGHPPCRASTVSGSNRVWGLNVVTISRAAFTETLTLRGTPGWGRAKLDVYVGTGPVSGDLSVAVAADDPGLFWVAPRPVCHLAPGQRRGCLPTATAVWIDAAGRPVCGRGRLPNNGRIVLTVPAAGPGPHQTYPAVLRSDHHCRPDQQLTARGPSDRGRRRDTETPDGQLSMNYERGSVHMPQGVAEEYWPRRRSGPGDWRPRYTASSVRCRRNQHARCRASGWSCSVWNTQHAAVSGRVANRLTARAPASCPGRSQRSRRWA